ncbi:MAG: sensor histidine kinase [Pseudomonadota bacterium]
MQQAKKFEPSRAVFHRTGRNGASTQFFDTEEILYSITHDLKGNLRALAELPTWIEEDLQYHNIDVPEDVRGHLSMMYCNARQLSNLVEGFISLSQAGRVPDGPHRSTVQEVALAAWGALEPGASFKLETHEAPDTLYLPKAAISEVFNAVLKNTLDHHDQKSGVARVTSETKGEHVCITIEDDGPGIPKDSRDVVFEALTRLRRREETGLAGLGLTLARKIVTRMGGSISVTMASNGRGTAVIFDVPVRMRW